MKKLIILCLIVFAAAYSSTAQTADRKWSVGLYGGTNQYAGDLGNGFYRCDKGLYGMGQLTFSRYINRFFDVSLLGNYGVMGYDKDMDSVFHTTFLHGNINIRLKFLGNDSYKLSPYIFAGLGGMRFKNLNNKSQKWNNAAIPACGFGLTYHVAPMISLQFQEAFIFSDYDNVDGDLGKSYYDNYMQHSLGVMLNFGKLKDSDNDGIADKNDKCPTVKGLLKFDGCPDTDGDGIVDADDACPGTPEKVKVDSKGCPLDTDGDGIADYLDKCPDVKGIAKLEGCPDSDNDGVADKDDKCPSTPPNVKVDAKGCPIDSDGDGVADHLDKCPTVKGPENLDGCPDRDGDGIADNIDKCPDVKGIAANKGCPEVKQEVKDVFQKALQGIQFETGKDIIRPVSFPILNNVAKIMKENKEYNLLINGHTDNVGDDQSNMTLSQKRADAVKAYLIKNGIDANRMKAFGYGETKPVDDNNTPAGRAKNRRVEFVVEF
ncbi:MAG TPA: OmpA family protein [Bacteroidales bacterium]|nr:OmpA family protein [Bacteroidales bacterium]